MMDPKILALSMIVGYLFFSFATSWTAGVAALFLIYMLGLVVTDLKRK